MTEPRPIDPRVDIGHVHLKVADLKRALGFYHGVLGFDIVQRLRGSAAFLSALLAGAAGAERCGAVRCVYPRGLWLDVREEGST